jgi:hypothetical protein
MAADGGSCVSDLAVLAGQGALFGNIASVSTARRVLLKVGGSELDGIRQARALARQRAWKISFANLNGSGGGDLATGRRNAKGRMMGAG